MDIIQLIFAISSLGTILGVVLEHVRTNRKFKMQEQEMRERHNRTQADIIKVNNAMNDYRRSVNQISGCLYQLLYILNADRVYIVQPHPLDKSIYVSTYFEVQSRGVSGIKDDIHKILIQDYSASYNILKNTDFLIYDNIKDIDDVKIRSMLSYNGGKSVACKRLMDSGDRYVGSMVCEWMDSDMSEVQLSIIDEMTRISEEIQFNLPPIDDGIIPV